MPAALDGLSWVPIVGAALGGALAAAGLMLWRVWPALRGRIHPGDSPDLCRAKWNDRLVPYLEASLRGQVQVSRAEVAAPTDPAVPPRTLALWTLTRTLLPDVELVALARPVAVPRTAGRLTRWGRAPATRIAPGEVLGVVPAATLRGILGGQAVRQTLYGHTVWICAWSPDAAPIDAVVAALTPLSDFLENHRWQPPAPARGEP